MTDCPFCQPDPEIIFYEDELGKEQPIILLRGAVIQRISAITLSLRISDRAQHSCDGRNRGLVVS